MNIKNNGEYKGQGYNMFQSSQWTVILNKNTPHCQSGGVQRTLFTMACSRRPASAGSQEGRVSGTLRKQSRCGTLVFRTTEQCGKQAVIATKRNMT